MISGYLFDHMQRAVEAAQTSHHPESKVGSALVINDQIINASPNFWPPAIEHRLGKIDKIGNTSATIHAETACLLHATQATEGASIFSTDPSCPNCAKNMAEAGIKHLYIDHKGFEKYFAQKRLEDFKTLTIPICQAAGISITRIFRKEKRTEEILNASADIKSHPYQILKEINSLQEQTYWAAGLCGHNYLLTPLSPSAGMTDHQIESDSKYNFDMQPLNRLLMLAARKGLEINPDNVYSSRVPTARELVNAIGADIKTLKIIDKTDARDRSSFEALKLLQENTILDIN